MSHPEELKQWVHDVSTHLPKLSKTEAMVLALYSLGMVVTGCCGITTISQLWSEVYKKSAGNYRQRLREWCYESDAKRGRNRQEIDVTSHFGDLLSWILSCWDGPFQLALVLDATHLTHRFTVLCVSVVYRGCAIPVAWKIVGGQDKGEWKPYWVELLDIVSGHVPDNWTVIVLTDRGLYAKWLYRAIQRCGWHPVMRINSQGLYKRPRQKTWQPLNRLLRPGMGIWCQRVICFKTSATQLTCTLLAQWDAQYDEGCLIVTDLPCDQIRHYWYDLRQWIEQGFKDMKRGGWRWEQTKMTNPQRAERLWFIMAVATLKVCCWGTIDDQSYTASAFRVWNPPKSPLLSVFRLGRIRFLASLLRREILPNGSFIPHDWHKAPI